MSLVPRCAYCDTTVGDLIAVALVASGSGPGWTYLACRPCRIDERLVPLAAQPSASLGGVHRWPEAVPHELVARLADLGHAPHLRPVTDRLFPATAATTGRLTPDHRRELARTVVAAAVADLRAAAGSGRGEVT
ncbi:hypothetical protein [Streptomyces avicenniae]|uniref:hypothetical protein n=1 Tax=Streptomyces avicenniae TaxID=500153 RepID=UPI00069BAC29|nr:hypothetical protein [Streptomyces avicenniae]